MIKGGRGGGLLLKRKGKKRKKEKKTRPHTKKRAAKYTKRVGNPFYIFFLIKKADSNM